MSAYIEDSGASVIEMCVRYADALIAIAVYVIQDCDGEPTCGHCDKYYEDGCYADCPGLLARRALGVA